MGVPFETLLPYGIMLGLFGVTGVGLAGATWFQNNHKRPRHGLDRWDRQMMERDYRITGKWREQSDNIKAPVGFELNNPWKVRMPVESSYDVAPNPMPDGESNHVKDYCVLEMYEKGLRLKKRTALPSGVLGDQA